MDIITVENQVTSVCSSVYFKPAALVEEILDGVGLKAPSNLLSTRRLSCLLIEIKILSCEKSIRWPLIGFSSIDNYLTVRASDHQVCVEL